MQESKIKTILLKTVVVVVILFAAFLLRAIMVEKTVYMNPIRNDAHEYYSYAVNLKYHDTYSLERPKSPIQHPTYQPTPDNHRPPGYPLFLYPFVKFPPDIDMVDRFKFVQSIIDTLTVLVAFGLFRQFLSYRLAVITSLLVAISPHLIAMNIYILTETLFTFALVLFLFVTASGLQTGSRIYMFVSGLLLAVTVLIKPTMNYFIIFLIGMIPFIVPKQKLIKTVFALMLGFVIVISPWVIRNLDITVDASPRALNSLKNGSYPGLMYNHDPATLSIPHTADPNYKTVKTISDFIPYLIAKVRQNPREYIYWYFFGKPLMFFSWDIVAGMGDVYIYRILYSPYFDNQVFRITHALMKGAHPIIVMASIAMMAMLLISRIRYKIPNASRIPLMLCAVLMFYFVLVHVIGNPLPRYAIPLIPTQYGLAIYFINFLYKEINERQKVRIP